MHESVEVEAAVPHASVFHSNVAKQPRRVLLHEPDPARRAAISVALREDGYLVTEVEPGLTPAHYLGSGVSGCYPYELPDLVLSQVDDDDLNHLVCLQRRDPPPLILFAESIDAQAEHRARAFGSAYLLLKTCRLHDLKLAVWSLAAP